MSLPDHLTPEGVTDPVTPSDVPPDYTWREAWLWAASWQAKDTHKVAFWQVIAMADGEAGVRISAAELAERLERSLSTAEQALRELADVDWIELSAGLNEAKHPIRTFITTKRVAG
jgi:hypothetical protein